MKSLLPALDRPIAFQRSFVRLTGSITAALFLSQAIYWTLRSQTGDGWFYKTARGWEDETGMTRREQDSARKRLGELGVLCEEKRDWPSRTYFRVDEEKLASCLAESANQTVWRKALTRIGEKRQPLLGTETTAETHIPLPPSPAKGERREESERSDANDGADDAEVEPAGTRDAAGMADSGGASGGISSGNGTDGASAGADTTGLPMRPVRMRADRSGAARAGGGIADPSGAAVRRVMQACHWTNRRLEAPIGAAIAQECAASGQTADEVAAAMAENWAQYVRDGPLLRFVWSPRKWIADGHWRNWNLWPYDQDRAERLRNASVGRMR